MHATFQSFPRDFPVCFQGHELIGDLGRALRPRTKSRAADTCRHFDWLPWISPCPQGMLILLEMQRDWTRHETYDGARAIVESHAGGYGIGLAYARDMIRPA